MQDEKWQEILGRVQDDFEVLDHGTEELGEVPGTVEHIIFMGPLGKMKLERTSRPLVLDKKALGSKRIGSDTHVEYIYSDTEKTHTFKAYRWDDGQDDWVEMESGRGDFSL
ncbi:MAG: hypothetical protein WC505_07820 [Patescibacteria group bacterium]